MSNDEGATTETKSMNIVERMAAIMGEMSAVGKTSRNQEQGYAFRGIDAFMNALHGPLVKYGVVITPRVLDRQSFERDRVRNGNVVGVTRVVEMLVEFTFHSPDGTTLTAVAAGEGADVADKATNKAMAGALKYAIMQTFMVPTQEMTDGDAQTPELQSGSSAAREQRTVAREMPPRAEIMRKLDEACDALGKSRAKLTEKWRQTNDLGAATQLDDPEKVSDVVLYQYVVSLQPYVQQALAQRDVPEPTADERAAAAQGVAAQAICDYTEGDKRCTLAPGHTEPHSLWG